MISLLWIAFLIAGLGGYGLWRGFSRDICLSLMLIASGAASAALIIISNTVSLVAAGIVVIISMLVCIWEGRHEGPRRAASPSTHLPAANLIALWQSSIRIRRAPRQGATPRKRPRQPPRV